MVLLHKTVCRNGSKQYALQCFCIPQKVIFNLREQAVFNLPDDNKELYERDLKQNAYDDGLQAGIEIGERQGECVGEQNKLLSLIKIKLGKGKSVEQIADELEETVESIEKLISGME